MKLLTALLFASTLSATTLTLTGVNGASADGYFTSPYYATLGTEQLTVYCDDFLDHADVGDSWQVNVLNGADVVSGAVQAYFQADYYKGIFGYVTLAIQNPADAPTIQLGLWGYTDPAFDGSAAASWSQAAQTVAVDPLRFLVLDDVNPEGRHQEFVVVANSPEPGTTWTACAGGLLVVIGAWIERRRK